MSPDDQSRDELVSTIRALRAEVERLRAEVARLRGEHDDRPPHYL